MKDSQFSHKTACAVQQYFFADQSVDIQAALAASMDTHR